MERAGRGDVRRVLAIPLLRLRCSRFAHAIRGIFGAERGGSSKGQIHSLCCDLCLRRARTGRVADPTRAVVGIVYL